jgi:L-lactate dehydrogenase complex protein LldG
MDIVRAAEAREVLAWDQAQLPLSGLTEALADAGVQALDSRLPAEGQARRARLAALGQAGVGVTGAEAALADTGTLVLSSGPGRSRLAWLLPPRHIALLPLARLYADLDAVLESHTGLRRDAAEVALVSGPSRTADIELTLTRGVHGPRDLDVVILV